MKGCILIGLFVHLITMRGLYNIEFKLKIGKFRMMKRDGFI